MNGKDTFEKSYNSSNYLWFKANKMSKTKGNVIKPVALFNSYRLSTIELYFSGISQEYNLMLKNIKFVLIQ